MSLREKQQMNLDTESGTHVGMEGQCRSSHKYLLLQVWCGLLTVAMVVMARFLISVEPKPAEDKVSTPKPVNATAVANGIVDSFKSTRPSPAYIQLSQLPNSPLWHVSSECSNCFLVMRNNSIHCEKESLYFIYAQVTFSKHHRNNLTKSVILKRNAMYGKSVRKLAGGIFPHPTEGTVWVGNIVNLKKGDSISLDITGDYLKDNTFWGAFQLH